MMTRKHPVAEFAVIDIPEVAHGCVHCASCDVASADIAREASDLDVKPLVLVNLGGNELDGRVSRERFELLGASVGALSERYALAVYVALEVVAFGSVGVLENIHNFGINLQSIGSEVVREAHKRVELRLIEADIVLAQKLVDEKGGDVGEIVDEVSDLILDELIRRLPDDRLEELDKRLESGEELSQDQP